MSFQIAPVFAVPLAQDQHPAPERLNQELKALLLSREHDPAYANPNPSLKQQPGVFESDFTLFSWNEPCIKELKAFVWAALGRTIQELNGYSADDMRRLQIFSHTWYHVTRFGGFTIMHNHPMASWSGVYCVTPGETPADRPESGVLRFQSPHHYSSYFMDNGNLRMAAPFHHGSWSHKFEAGQLVIFPSWLQHEVLPFFGSDERITIAFNTWFSMRE